MESSAATGLLLVAKETLLSLLSERDFLGIQLSYAHGEIEEDDFAAIVHQRSSEQASADADALAKKAARLTVLVRGEIDADLVATAFRCSLEQARDALRRAPAALESEHADLDAILRVLWPSSEDVKR